MKDWISTLAQLCNQIRQGALTVLIYAGEPVNGAQQQMTSELQQPCAIRDTTMHRPYMYNASSPHVSFPHRKIHHGSQCEQVSPDFSTYRQPSMGSKFESNVGSWTNSTTLAPTGAVAARIHGCSSVHPTINSSKQGAHGLNKAATGRMHIGSACADSAASLASNRVGRTTFGQAECISTIRSSNLSDSRTSAYYANENLHRKRSYPSCLIPLSKDRSGKHSKSSRRDMQHKTCIHSEAAVDASFKPAKSGCRTKHGSKPQARLDVFGGRL